MGRKKKKSSGKSSGGGDDQRPTTAAEAEAAAASGSCIRVDPNRVRFQHSRIRPTFSGCSRSVEGTLADIREGRMRASDLPPIQVIVGPDDDGEDDSGEGPVPGPGPGPWYFSLNNRRLWVLKRCREEGLLDADDGGDGTTVRVRVRMPRSAGEAARYTLEKCAVEAKFIRERPAAGGGGTDAKSDAAKKGPERRSQAPDGANVRENGMTSADAALDDEVARCDRGGPGGDFRVEVVSDGDEDETETSSDVSDSDDEQRRHHNPFSALM